MIQLELLNLLLLDVCITSSPEKIISSGVIHLGISDHSLIYAIRKLNYVPKIGARNLIEYRNFKYFNAESFLNDLYILPWIEIDKKENVDKMWECWKSLFVQVLDKQAPLKTKRVRKRGSVPWINKDARTNLFERDFLKRKAIKTNKQSYWNKYKSSRNSANIALHQTKREYYTTKLLVYTLIMKLPISKSVGLDKISTKLPQIAAPAIAQPLTKIFNKAIDLGQFPIERKAARVIPIFKEGQQTILDNYRPISILPVVSKLMERILYNQLSKYLEKESILSEYQFGFRSHHSTTTTLIDCSNEWYVNMDRGHYNLVVFLDIKKAFDTVNHDILLKRLEMYGLGDLALAPLRSYLTDRTQKCHLQDMLSKQRKITCGIPQGSILGPLLFTLYINELPNCLKHTTRRMFADDTSLTAARKTLSEVEKRANEDLRNVHNWLSANKLNLNIAKTEYVLIGSRHRINSLDIQPSINIDKQLLKESSIPKCSGFKLTSI